MSQFVLPFLGMKRALKAAVLKCGFEAIEQTISGFFGVVAFFENYAHPRLHNSTTGFFVRCLAKGIVKDARYDGGIGIDVKREFSSSVMIVVVVWKR